MFARQSIESIARTSVCASLPNSTPVRDADDLGCGDFLKTILAGLSPFFLQLMVPACSSCRLLQRSIFLVTSRLNVDH